MSEQGNKVKVHKPLHAEWLVIAFLGGFFALMAIVYAVWSGLEPVGSTALTLLVGLCAVSGGYLFKLSREIDLRPEDDPHGESYQAAGEVGHFSPWSWWPLVCGLAVALVFLGPALHQWWVAGIGAALGLIGTAGHVLEYNRGPHAH